MVRVDPNYYIILCAKRYAETCRKLHNGESSASTAATVLGYLLEGGQEEAQSERRWRERYLSADVSNWVRKKKDATRPLTTAEIEATISYYAVPPIGLLPTHSASQLHFLADLLDGWAATRRLDVVLSLRMMGMADGYRILADALGADYLPPPLNEGPSCAEGMQCPPDASR